MSNSKTQEHVQTGLIVATAMEVLQDNSLRSSSVWKRAGIFAATVLTATLVSMGLDAMLDWFRNKRNEKEMASLATLDGIVTAATEADSLHHAKTSWAQDITTEKPTAYSHARQ